MACQVITVMNMKGGVGKTTVCAHLAGAVARSAEADVPRRVLMIDYDPQFNLTQTFLPAKTYFSLETKKKTILSVLVDDDDKLDPFKIQVPGTSKVPAVADLAQDVHLHWDKSTLALVPSTLDLMYIALGRTDKSIAPIKQRFAKFIAQARQNFDFIFIDCHPAGSILTETAISQSDHILVPVAPSKYAIRGVGLMERFLDAKAGVSPPRMHVLFNDVPRVGQDKVETEIRSSKYKENCLVSTLKHYKAFSDPQEGKDFVFSSGRAWSTSAYINLFAVAREFLRRIDQ